jgi:hypothetical protein
MNERIRGLVRQADVHILPDESEYGHTIIGLEKFAELIVRECAQFIFVLDAEPVSHKSAARMLQEHFGVKE